MLTLVAAGAQAQQPAATGCGEKPTLVPMLREVAQAIVNIAMTSEAKVPSNPLSSDPFFRRFFDLPGDQ